MSTPSDTSQSTTTPQQEGPPPQNPPPVVVSLEVVAWNDAVLASQGYDPRSEYVERFWLGLIGPSATWLMRRLARGLDSLPDGFRIDLAETSKALGLGQATGPNSSVQRTINRLCQFGLSQRIGPNRLSVRQHLPPLTRRQLDRLPDAVQNAHDEWSSRHDDPDERRRARAAALGLARAGDPFAVVEKELRSWGFPPPIAHDAVVWAVEMSTES